MYKQRKALLNLWWKVIKDMFLHCIISFPGTTHYILSHNSSVHTESENAWSKIASTQKNLWMLDSSVTRLGQRLPAQKLCPLQEKTYPKYSMAKKWGRFLYVYQHKIIKINQFLRQTIQNANRSKYCKTQMHKYDKNYFYPYG